MRNLALSSLVILTAVAGSARADNNDYRYHARTHEVAAAEPLHAYAPGQAGAQLSKGELALMGAEHPRATLETGDRRIDAIQNGAGQGEHHARREPWLSNTDVQSLVAPHSLDIEHCYLDQVSAARQGGKLDLTLTIGSDGSLVSLKAATAGLSRSTTHKIESCARQVVASVEFPARRNDTTVVVPFLFHKTHAAGAGPIESCWSASGCR